jgi:hypothetical protein
MIEAKRGIARHDESVDPGAAFGRFAPHQAEVLGGEDDTGDEAEDVFELHRIAIDPSSVGSFGLDGHLDGGVALIPVDQCGHCRSRSALVDERSVEGDPVGALMSEIPDRLDDIGLPGPVVGHECGDSG